MKIIHLTIVAFSMSADAFAASLSKGVKMPHPHLSEALKIGAIFGIMEGITPIIGWLFGIAASAYVEAVDHWIAFAILAIVGGRMILESLEHDPDEPKKKAGLIALLATAFGTSIDAMATGVSFAFLDVNILLASAMIGGATFLMSTTGFMVGHYIGTKGGHIAELLGGIFLILIGTHILLSHLGVIAF